MLEPLPQDPSVAHSTEIRRIDLLAHREPRPDVLEDAQGAALRLRCRKAEQSSSFSELADQRGIDSGLEARWCTLARPPCVGGCDLLEQRFGIHGYRISQSSLKRARARASSRSTDFSVRPVASAIWRT